MPKKEFAKIGKEPIKQKLKETGLPRNTVAEKMGVTVGAIDKWLANGAIPTDQLRSLDQLLRDMSGSASVHSMSPLGEQIAGSTTYGFLVKEESKLDRLIREIESMGYEVFLRKIPNK